MFYSGGEDRAGCLTVKEGWKGKKNRSTRGILGWPELEKLCLAPKLGGPAWASAHFKHQRKGVVAKEWRERTDLPQQRDAGKQEDVNS